MCGICGFATDDTSRQLSRELLDCMTDPLFHRGPDSKGAYLAPGVGLGIRRLSIIDVEGGDQPVSNEDGAIRVICNGEIYNYLELRQLLEASGHTFKTRSDVEVIAHLYEDHGVDCLRFLRGMFALALWDERQRQLFLARDRFGIKPLHYFRAPGALYFSSEQKSFLPLPEFSSEPDPDSLGDLFRFGFPLGDKTMFRRVRVVPPAHYMVFGSGEISRGRYWEARLDDEGQGSPKLTAAEWAEGLAEKLEETVRIHLRSDVPVGAWLSPGLDSSSIVAMMERLGAPPNQTVTIWFEGAQKDEAKSRPTLDRYSGHNISNCAVTCPRDSLRLLPRAAWHCEQPFSGGLEIARMLLGEAASRFTKVVLTGEGADEVFGGYHWYSWNPVLKPFSYLPLGLRRLVFDVRPLRERYPGMVQTVLAPPNALLERFRTFMAPAYGAELMGHLLAPEWQTSGAGANGAEVPPDLRSAFLGFQWCDLNHRLPHSIVHHLDRGAMAHSVEARVPYLDHELVEFALRIPVGLKLRRFEEKHILRECLRGILPEPIRRRRKWGMRAPIQSWLLAPLPDYARRLLAPETLRAKGYFTPAAVADLLAQHKCGRDSVRRVLMVILGVQLWDELFRQRRTWNTLA